jgi:purine-nucleoside phosphorylase
VPEVIAARYLGMEVLGVSMVTNMAAGVLDQPLRHEEVIETAAAVIPALGALLGGVLEELGVSTR